MYQEKQFNIPKLIGISQLNIDEHLKLYSGYVKNTNLILKTIHDASVTGYALSEMQRRFSFEYNGMKNHEYYFSQLENQAVPINLDGELAMAITNQWGSFAMWRERFTEISKTRGIGWAILYWDNDAQLLVNGWVDEQHLGLLNSARFIFGIDMWEHAFVYDYQPSGKEKYINDYFSNVNFGVVEDLFRLARN